MRKLVWAFSVVCGCGAAEQAFEPTASRIGKADGVSTSVTSPNARAGARYMKERSETALLYAGALSALEMQVLQRIHGYGQSAFGIDALAYAEDPTRYATFLPAEQAAFKDLWKLLEIDDTLDLTAKSDFAPLTDVVPLKQPDAKKLDDTARVDITKLPALLQDVARRVVKTPNSAADTISFAEVVTALANYQSYTAAEYFRFDALLRSIEGQLIEPAGFPRLEYTADPAQTATVNFGGVTLTAKRTLVSEFCPGKFITWAKVSTQTNLTFAIPSGTNVTWTRLSSNAQLARDRGSWSTNVDWVDHPTATYFLQGSGDVAIVEAWRNGLRVAQTLAIVPGDEAVTADGAAVVKNGAFDCLPYEEPDLTTSLPNVVRLPPGRYPIAAGSYGTAVLNLYGRSIVNMEIGGKSFWDITRRYTAQHDLCWDMSDGGVNTVTGASGVGPSFHFEFGTSEIRFLEAGSTCSGGGTATILSSGNRLP